MRKKYLSALLFGALLVTSAGTFTSCKDYDDDINNLQEQIDKVVSDLESLKTTVEGLGGVTAVKVEDGKLIVTAGGKDVSYDLPAGAEMEEIKIENDHLYVGDKDLGQVTGEVTVNEDGVLMIGGEEAGLKVGTEVIIKDSSNGMYTIQIGDQTVQLPMASANIVAIIDENAVVTFDDIEGKTTTYGILWGVSKEDHTDWAGPKGGVEKGDLLIGQINNAEIRITPSSYDLGAQSLKLIDSEGNYAPVNVNAVAAGSDSPLYGGSARTRATDKQGKWNLVIDMTDEVTAENIANIFATKVGSDYYNVKYALEVNGSIVSDYVYMIDTYNSTTGINQKETYSDTKVSLEGGEANTNDKWPLNTPLTFKYEGSRVYDYYITFASEDENDAEKYEVSLKDNVITASDKAAGQTFKFNVHLLSATGEITEGTYEITFAGTSSEIEELAPSEYKVPLTLATDTKYILLNLGDTFSSLTAEQATSITGYSWSTEDETFVIPKTNLGNIQDENCVFYEDEAGKKPVSSLDSEANVKKIKYAKLNFNNYNSAAVEGKHIITLTLKATQGTTSAEGEIKKVNIPVNVTLPTFDELFKNSDEWVDGKFNARVVLGSNVPQINFTRAFVPVSNKVGFNANFDLTVDEVKINGTNVVGNDVNGILSLTTGAVYKKEFAVSTLQVKASYKIEGVKGFEIPSSKFTTNVSSIAAGIELVYLGSDGKEAATATVTSNNEITIAQWDNDKKYYKNGLALKFGDKYAPLFTNSSTSNIGFVLGVVENTQWTGQANKLVLDPSTPNLTDVTVSIPNTADGVVKLNGLSIGTASTLKVTVTDVMGVVIPLTINFK